MLQFGVGGEFVRGEIDRELAERHGGEFVVLAFQLGVALTDAGFRSERAFGIFVRDVVVELDGVFRFGNLLRQFGCVEEGLRFRLLAGRDILRVGVCLNGAVPLSVRDEAFDALEGGLRP